MRYILELEEAERREDANGTKKYGAGADWRRKDGVNADGQESLRRRWLMSGAATSYYIYIPWWQTFKRLQVTSSNCIQSLLFICWILPPPSSLSQGQVKVSSGQTDLRLPGCHQHRRPHRSVHWNQPSMDITEPKPLCCSSETTHVK